jgi:hypothetical protein
MANAAGWFFAVVMPIVALRYGAKIWGTFARRTGLRR